MRIHKGCLEFDSITNGQVDRLGRFSAAREALIHGNKSVTERGEPISAATPMGLIDGRGAVYGLTLSGALSGSITSSAAHSRRIWGSAT